MSKIIVLKKGLVTFIVTFAAVASVALSAIITSVSVQTRSTAMMTVVIDPGHGGIDGGVTGVATGALESELNLAVAKLLRDDFRAAGFRVVMTRSTSAGLYGNAQGSLKRADMQNRKKIIEKAEPDLVLSIHMNKFELQSRRGA